MLFEDAGNQWSLSRPILSLIMTSEQVPSFIFYSNSTYFFYFMLLKACLLFWFVFFLLMQMFSELRAHILASQVRTVLCLKFYIPLEPLVPFCSSSIYQSSQICWNLSFFFLLDAPNSFTKWVIVICFKRSNANLIYRLWTSNNAFHNASISWWRMSTGTWSLRIATDSLKTWQHLDVISDWSNSSLEPAISLKEVFLHDVNTPVTFFLGTTILWGFEWFALDWLKMKGLVDACGGESRCKLRSMSF